MTFVYKTDQIVLQVECLGACVNAPMVQVNDDYYVSINTAFVTSSLETVW